MEEKNFHQKKPNTSNNIIQSSNSTKGYIVIPYKWGLYESIKKSVVSMVSKHISKVKEQLRTSL